MAHHSKVVASIVVQNLALPEPGVVAERQFVDEVDEPNYIEAKLTIPPGGSISIDFDDIGIKPTQIVLFTNHHVRLEFGVVVTDETNIRNMYVATFLPGNALDYLRIDNAGEPTQAVCKLIVSGPNS